jgi:hypothetical protein
VSTQLLVREGYQEHLPEGVAAEDLPKGTEVEAAPDTPHEPAVPWDRPVQSEERAIFNFLANELAGATAGFGSLGPATRHPAYREILALGRAAVPFLLERVDDPVQGPLWMRLLGSLIGFPPMLQMDTVGDAAEAWRIWGRANGHVAQ